MTLTEIASRIDTALKRAAIKGFKNSFLHLPSCFRSCRYIYIKYINYQHAHTLTKDKAEAYLAWLDAGNVGSHHKQQREAEAARIRGEE